MSWSDLPLDRPVATVALLVSLMVLGAVGVTYIPLDYFPMVKEPEVDVAVPFPGAHPMEGLEQVARPIEEELATIPDVKRIFTHVEADNVWLEAMFDWTTNIDLKRIEVREAVERARARLPGGVGHIRVEGEVDSPGGGTVLRGRVSAKRDLGESWALLDRKIRRPLERVPGVARVDLDGVEPQQVRIDLDLDALRRHGVDPAELMRHVEQANLDLDLGTIRDEVARYGVRSVGRYRDLEAIRDVRVGDGDVRVRDVARVEQVEPRLTYGRHLDRSFAIGLDVFKEPSANTVATVDRVMRRIEEIERDPELEGVQLLVWNNAADQIRIAIDGLRNAGIFGGLLALGVLYLFLRRMRTTLIVAVAIPFSLLVTCGAMYLLGMKLDVLSMLGLMLGVGMLVDNAVVVIENIHRLQSAGMAPDAAARRGVRQVALAVLASTATTLIVWSWILITPRGPMTIYMGIFAGVICMAVTCSLLISLTFIPLAAARFVPHAPARSGAVMRRVLPAYRRLIGWTLRHRFVTLVALAALGASFLVPLSRIEKSGDTREQEQDVTIHYRIHDPSTKDVLEGYVDRVESWLEQRKPDLGYERIYSWFNEPSEAQTRLFLAPGTASEKSIATLREKLQADLPSIAGVELEVGDRNWWRRGGGAQGRRMVQVALRGEDPDHLERLAAGVEQRVHGIPDVVDVWGPAVGGRQEVRLAVDAERAASLGVRPQAVAETVGLAFRGRPLRRFQTDSGELEIRLGLPEESRPGVAALRDLPVPRGADRAPVPLEAVADVAITRTLPSLTRIDRRTTIHVSVQFEETVTTDEARRRIETRLAGLDLPAGYSWDFGSWGDDHDEALGVMARGVALALVVVILLMAALFESFSQPLAIVITLPLAFFGSFWALWLAGFELDVLAFIGVILLIGLVVNNGIVMVDHVNTLRREGRARVDALIEGCGDRFRPVLMTAITTFFGLLPLAFSPFTVAGVYIDSMAVAIIGGLASSTLFTLVALPVWYTTVEDVASLLPRLLPRRTGGRAGRREAGVLADVTGSSIDLR